MRLPPKSGRVIQYHSGNALYDLNGTQEDPTATDHNQDHLLMLARYWADLGTGVPCPIKFLAQELEAHKQISEGWNETADFWSSLDGYVSSDGYTAHEDYDEARNMFSDMRKKGMATLEGKELADFDAI